MRNLCRLALLASTKSVYDEKKTKESRDMSNDDEFFAEMHPQIAQVIGMAVMQLLVEGREITKAEIIETIQVLWQEEQVDLAVELALDVLMLPKE